MDMIRAEIAPHKGTVRTERADGSHFKAYITIQGRTRFMILSESRGDPRTVMNYRRDCRALIRELLKVDA